MDLLIFDLDGTLIDSKLDLAHSVNATRSYMQLPPIAPELVYSYVGNGAPVLIRRALGPQASEAEVERALDFFVRYYAQHCLDNTALYPSVEAALRRLQEAKIKMAVLTNKPVRISTQIVRDLGIGPLFFRIYGGNSFEFKKPSPVGVEALLCEARSARERTVMIGDSPVDVLTARNARVRACGVTYGFQPDSLREASPDWLVDDINQLADYVLEDL